MKRSEASEQITLIQWCDINRCKYPELGLIFHIPNGGKRNKLEAIKLKKEGVVLSLNFVTLRCGILTVTLRARFRARLSYQAGWNV